MGTPISDPESVGMTWTPLTFQYAAVTFNVKVILYMVYKHDFIANVQDHIGRRL